MKTFVKNSAQKKLINTFFLFLALFLFNGCKLPDPYFDQEIYNSTINLKNQTIELMKKGEEAYSIHNEEINKILNDANSIYKRQKLRKKNQISILQWEKLLVGTNNGKFEGILTGYFNEWKKTGKIHETAYIEAKITNVTIAFDEILNLEKQKDNRVNTP